MNTRKITSNFLWRFAERCGAQFVTFVVSVILARILDPSLYGSIALMMVFITIVQVFVDSGLGNALIQKKDSDDLDFSTVFFTNLVICISMYIILFLSAPLIASFYDDLTMIPMLRVLGITVLVSGVKNVQQAYVSKHMLFKTFFFSTLIGTISAAIVGIFLAVKGYGAWALVVQQVVNVSMDTVVVWLTVKWRPKRMFSFRRLRVLFSFGWKLLVSALLDTGYNKLRELLIGKVYSASDLAYYERGQKLPELVIANINTSIDSVLLPAMSEEQDDKSKVREMTRQSIRISVYVMAPLMMGLAFAADTIIMVLLGEKWMPCIPFLRIFCITYMFYPIHTANLNAIKAMGRSDMFLRLEIIKKIVGLSLLVITVNISVMAMTYVLLISSLLSQIINSWPNRKLLDYKYEQQVMDILPSIFLALIMGVIVYLLGFIQINVYVLLAIQIIAGAAIYIGGSWALKLEPCEYILRIAKGMRKKQ